MGEKIGGWGDERLVIQRIKLRRVDGSERDRDRGRGSGCKDDASKGLSCGTQEVHRTEGAWGISEKGYEGTDRH